MPFPEFWFTVFACASAGVSAEVIDLGGRRELFVDHFLIERLEGARLKLEEPRWAGVAVAFDRQWEGIHCGYPTVIRDGGLVRLYYRGLPVSGKDGSNDEVTCYAESQDGIHWQKPDLGLFEVRGTRKNNVILAGHAPASHNFCPFLDARPGASPSERFKAVGGTAPQGLLAFASADGLHWRKLSEKPILSKGAFDSQNVVFWSESESAYLCYFRTWSGGGYSGFRSVSRATSPDLLNWSDPAPMEFGGAPPEHLYTNQTLPYFRAPHLYIAMPMRFMPGRKVLTDGQAKELGVAANYSGDCADSVLMTSRGGNRYDRTFLEGWIRPGADLGNWASRAGLTALGIVQTGPAEISIYKQANYAQPAARLDRYVLRLDGFASVNAPYAGGEMVTKAFKFSGRELEINFATSAAGGIWVEIQDQAGKPIAGHTLADSSELIGDDAARPVSWKQGADLSRLAGQAVKLRFKMKDADLYSLRFKNQ
ncbi:MAG: hypothetical protein HY717_12050 [Planctomycetes bacterium]|nr:hypothetical protein [Planctomycetota bacterium]